MRICDAECGEGVFGFMSGEGTIQTSWLLCAALERDGSGILLSKKELVLLVLPSHAECSQQRTRSLSFLFRKDHLSSPPVPYEKLQKLLEAVLKRCVDLSPPHSSSKHEVSQEVLCSLVVLSRTGMILLAHHVEVACFFHLLTCDYCSLWCFFWSSWLEMVTVFVKMDAGECFF